jgi:hypothetical protein
MRKQLAFLLTVAALSVGCKEADRDTDTGAVDARDGADTTVTSETVKDTTVVTADTSIDVDTVKQTDNIDDANEKKD